MMTLKNTKPIVPETPEAIKIAVPYIHQILEAIRIPILGVEGYEAI